jgi:hypothetical protein
LIAASSVFHRSSWKFDQETPTVMSFAAAAKEERLAEASNVVPSANAIANFISFPPLEVPAGPAKRLSAFVGPDSQRQNHSNPRWRTGATGQNTIVG